MNMIDNRALNVINKIVDMFVISVLWCVFSIPIITIGLSTAAAYQAIVKVIRGGKGYAIPTFFAGLKNSWRQSIGWTLILGVIGFALFQIAYMLWPNLSNTMTGVYFGCTVCLMCALVLFGIQVFPLIGRFNLSNRGIFTVATRLIGKHLPIALAEFFSAMVFLGVSIWYPPLLFFTPSATFLIFSLLQEPRFHLYINYTDDEFEDF